MGGQRGGSTSFPMIRAGPDRSQRGGRCRPDRSVESVPAAVNVRISILRRRADVPSLTWPGDAAVIHAHHRYESLLARTRYPHLPLIFTGHGVLPWQEQPAVAALGASRYVAAVSYTHLTLPTSD